MDHVTCNTTKLPFHFYSILLRYINTAPLSIAVRVLAASLTSGKLFKLAANLSTSVVMESAL